MKTYRHKILCLFFAWLARQLWPYLAPHVAAQTATDQAARPQRRYIGDRP